MFQRPSRKSYAPAVPCWGQRSLRPSHGELGGRSFDITKDRQKRDYVEKYGQFDGMFSYNLRTPPSRSETPSGKRIYTLTMMDKQPDELVRFLIERRDAILGKHK